MTGRTLTRADISVVITRKLGVSQAEASALIDGTLEEVAAGLKKAGTVKLSGFGNFVIHKKKERVGRNPKTGKTAKISARKSVSFHPSLMLKKQING